MRYRTTLGAALGAAMFASAASAQCYPDCDGSGTLDFFDFLCFQNAFATGDPYADCDGSGTLDFFDFLCFQNEFAAGCPSDPAGAQLAARRLSAFPHADYVRTFDAGETIQLALDPADNPGLGGQTADVYIVAAKDAAQWAADPTLIDVRPGLSQPVAFPASGAVEDNTFDLLASGALFADAGEDIGVGYDLVIDANRNGVLDGGDVIDGLGDETGFWVFKDLTLAGPAATSRVETYTAVFPGIPSTRNQQRLTYPADIASRTDVPVVIISHGNWQDYRWYDYMHDHFASHGWVVMSHQNDTVPGIETASTTTLTHTDYFFGNLATIAGGALDGRLDKSRTVWIGHSRGGEGVVRAYDRIVTGSYNPVNYSLSDILVVSSIAPTDFGTRARPNDVNYHFIYGSSDGDVRGRPGSGSKPWAIFERATGTRTATYIQGADHNDFNCCGFNDFEGPAGTEIGREEVQRVAKIDWLCTIQHFVRGNEPALDYLQRQWESLAAPALRASTIVDNEWKDPRDPGRFVIDDYQTNPSTAQSSSGQAVLFSVGNLFEGLMRDLDGVLTWAPTDPMNGMTRVRPGAPDDPMGVVFDWTTGSTRFYELAVAPAARDFTQFKLLSFRGCQGTRHPETVARLGDLSFTVTLRDGSGATSSIDFGAYGGGLEEPYQRTGEGTGAGWANEFEVIRIQLADFLRNQTPLDMTDIVAVRFDFGAGFGDERGRVAIDDVELMTR
ncbi:MAG: hypothetical protein ACF8R7_17235 [Phycisphaerales bacterium JB039]